METEKMIQLMDAMAQTSLEELEYQEGSLRLVLRRRAGTPAAAPAETVSRTPAQTVEGTEAETVVFSPLVGTFYRAPGEDAEPFVQVGDSVRKGQVLGIIETMKLMNEIECEQDGVVTAVLAENEQVVEYGQPLFRIR